MRRIWTQKTLALLLIAVLIAATAQGLYPAEVYAAEPREHTLAGEGEPELGDLKVDVKDGNIMLYRYRITDSGLVLFRNML